EPRGGGEPGVQADSGIEAPESGHVDVQPPEDGAQADLKVHGERVRIDGPVDSDQNAQRLLDEAFAGAVVGGHAEGDTGPDDAEVDARVEEQRGDDRALT